MQLTSVFGFFCFFFLAFHHLNQMTAVLTQKLRCDVSLKGKTDGTVKSETLDAVCDLNFKIR